MLELPIPLTAPSFVILILVWRRLHNKVVFHAMKALNGFGFPVLRFNFAGRLSQGEHNQGDR